MSSELAPIRDTSQQALKMVAIGSDNDAVIRDAGYQSLNPLLTTGFEPDDGQSRRGTGM